MPQRLSDIDLLALAPASPFPSPAAWEDEVLYFALVDRFSDGKEDGYRDSAGTAVPGTTPRFAPANRLNAVGTEADAAVWREAGKGYVGGTLRGMASKLGYLRRLGVTALWVSPVLKQVAFDATYHGYGTQDFLQVNPRFGSEQDLKDLVRRAHEHGIRVILDVVLNHSGDVFAYAEGDPAWDSRSHAVRGFRDATGQPLLPFRASDSGNPATWPGADDAIWPVELQTPDAFTCKGHIRNFDADPEFRDGDFFSLKDLHHGQGSVDDYRPSPALLHLCQAYKYWIAVADLDGFRVDTVKHMDPGAARFFASSIHEFALEIGKENFYLIGEITGSREFAVDTMEITGLDAALGIADVGNQLEFVPKGISAPNEYFSLFRNSALIGKESHTWLRNRVVTSFDDHDQVRKGANKARFCADGSSHDVLLSALALNATTLGIPCIYYGSEQAFDGHGGGDFADRYIREAMFGGSFGAFATRGVHFFDETHPVYRGLARILELRRRSPVLRKGRQYLREISGDGVGFGLPQRLNGPLRSVIAWSRLLSDRETLLAINTDPGAPVTAWVTVDASLNRPGDQLTCRFSTVPAQEGTTTTVEARNGSAVRVTVPAGAFVVYGK
jgi:glycosidase